MYRLNVARILKAAEARGDRSAYAIAKRTGVNTSSAYRILTGQTQPDLNSALRLADAYGLDVSAFMDRVDEPQAVA
ncbi:MULTISPECIES: helix-turn-helix transcriptional regulator [unclassified Streptomyces]|uniref:helix-turn-helix domain-containing protein n=1 Tax=unclassified Streptomyces TaxID=2593676 RepID=UPI002E189BCF|nr:MULTISPECIES: helix-turn-helix transcriptional regulator [unclassified Streptomyces]